MKITAALGCRTVTCELCCDQETSVQTEEELTELLPETVKYAVCRFLAHNQALCAGVIRNSYTLRFGKRRTGPRFEMVLPAPLLELPVGWVKVRGAVRPDGIHIRSICLSRDYPR